MSSSRDIVRGLRRALANAICEAQDIVTPRSPIDLMRCSLLWRALAALDPHSGASTVHAIQIASHALAEWRKRERQKALLFAQGDG